MKSSSTRPAAFALIAISASVYWATAYPTITWWDSSSYSLAAATLGVASAPGSLLLTLLGWPISKLSFDGSPAHTLNLFAGALAAIVVALLYAIAVRMRTPSSRSATIGVALGALTFAFSDTLWDHAVKFTPYVLSAVFTGLILWTMIRWWDDADRPDSWHHIALLGLLFGLDFSVHRTNALLLPGVLAWVLIRCPRTLTQLRPLAAGAGGLVVGLAVQLLVIPIAAFGRSPLNFHDPSNWPRFWNYITLKDLGGSFLLQLLPRKSDLWSVQSADVLRVIGLDFFHLSGPAGVLGALPAVAAGIGLVSLWRANPRMTAAFVLVLLTQAAATVLYFNIPADYFRAFDRHYLPVCVTIAVLMACGLGVVIEWARTLVARSRVAAVALSALACAAPIAQLIGNWSARNASHNYFARDWAANSLQRLPPNAIYFTVGDNDTFPPLYLQAVEGVRRDVTIINLSVAAANGYVERMRRRDPSFPLSSTVSPAELAFAASTRPVTYATTIVGTGRPWPEDHGRLEGLFWRIYPHGDIRLDPDSVRSALLEHAQYRGWADSSVVIDDTSRDMGLQYYSAGMVFLAAEHANSNDDRCRADLRALQAALPPERLHVPADYRKQLGSICGSQPPAEVDSEYLKRAQAPTMQVWRSVRQPQLDN